MIDSRKCGAITLLIIDDDPTACRLFKKIIGSEGFSVLAATTAQRGLQLVREKSPEIVFLDIKMPRIDGIELLRRIRKIDKDVIVIMLTGYATLDTARKAMELGAYDYVTKPFDLEAIKASIRDALEVTPPPAYSPKANYWPDRPNAGGGVNASD